MYSALNASKHASETHRRPCDSESREAVPVRLPSSCTQPSTRATTQAKPIGFPVTLRLAKPCLSGSPRRVHSPQREQPRKGSRTGTVLRVFFSSPSPHSSSSSSHHRARTGSSTRRGEQDRHGFASLRVTGTPMGETGPGSRVSGSQGHQWETQPSTRSAAQASRREPSGFRDPDRRDSPTRASQGSYVTEQHQG